MRAKRINAAILAVSGFMLAMAIYVHAQDKSATTKPMDVSGTWKWTAQGFGGDMETTLTLKQDGDKLSGTVTGFAGDTQISDGKVVGDKISFKVTNDFNGNQFVTNYSGTVSGDSFKGKSEVVISNPIDAKRSK